MQTPTPPYISLYTFPYGPLLGTFEFLQHPLHLHHLNHQWRHLLPNDTTPVCLFLLSFGAISTDSRTRFFSLACSSIVLSLSGFGSVFLIFSSFQPQTQPAKMKASGVVSAQFSGPQTSCHYPNYPPTTVHVPFHTYLELNMGNLST